MTFPGIMYDHTIFMFLIYEIHDPKNPKRKIYVHLQPLINELKKNYGMLELNRMRFLQARLSH